MKQLLQFSLLALVLAGCFNTKLNMMGEEDEYKDYDQSTSSESELDDEDYSDEFAKFRYMVDSGRSLHKVETFLKSLKSKNSVALNVLYKDKKSDGDEESFIHYAAVRGSLDLVKKILELSENREEMANLKTGYEVTPLQLASLRGSYDIVKYLVDDCNADINAKDDKGASVLHYAAELYSNADITEKLKVFKFLIQADAKIEETTDLLHWAVEGDNLFLVEYLLEKFPNLVGIKMKYGEKEMTAEDLAIALKRRSIVKRFSRFKK
jgi:ankyrin repeat protein